MNRSMLIISRQSPWSGPGAREALDIALAGGAYDLPIGLLFLDDGVLQLATEQQPAALQQRDLTSNLKALPLFGVDELFACSRSLAERGLATSALKPEVAILDAQGVTDLINRYDQVITL